MLYRFEIKLNDEDYLKYNKFWMFRSPYGKKQIISMRLSLVAIALICAFISLFGGGFSLEAFLGIIPILLVLILVQLLLKPSFGWTLKSQIKHLKKQGKPGYSAEAVLEFFEDSFTETTPDNKTENKYSAVERISLVDGEMIYLHVNNLLAYILPVKCFESREQFESFLEFIKQKCGNVEVY